MTTPADEASAILIRMFDTIAAGMGKRLKDAHKAEIRRACELLSMNGALAPLDDLPAAPRVSPAEAVVNFVEEYRTDPGFRAWEQRKREERER